MTRSDLVARLAERFAQLTQRDTEFAVKTILDAMSDALARGCYSNTPSRSHLVATHFSPAITGSPPCRVFVDGCGRS